MHKKQPTIKSVFSYLLLISSISLLVFSGSVWGNCIQIYPDADVVANLSNTAYQNCTLSEMIQKYADLVKERHRLLTDLRPAYESKLDKLVVSAELTKEELTARLNEYNTTLNDFLTKKESFEAWVLETEDDRDADEVQPITQVMKTALKGELENCEEESQALKRKINWARDEIASADNNKFCMLDFYFRVSERLNLMISGCLETNN